MFPRPGLRNLLPRRRWRPCSKVMMKTTRQSLKKPLLPPRKKSYSRSPNQRKTKCSWTQMMMMSLFRSPSQWLQLPLSQSPKPKRAPCLAATTTKIPMTTLWPPRGHPKVLLRKRTQVRTICLSSHRSHLQPQQNLPSHLHRRSLILLNSWMQQTMTTKMRMTTKNRPSPLQSRLLPSANLLSAPAPQKTSEQPMLLHHKKTYLRRGSLLQNWPR